MTDALWLANAWNWALQVCLLVGAAGLTIGALRVDDPRLRLRVWHGVVLVSLLLPLLQPWYVVPSETPAAASSTLASARFPWAAWIGSAAIGGIVLRAIWLTTGLRKLRRLRLAADSWRPMPPWYREVSKAVGASAGVGVSRDIHSAVTFGVRHPSILVPEALRSAPEAHQRAVIAHELTHVARRDWLWVLAEEGVRTALWCHPAVWFALGEAQLAREEVVDRRAIDATGNRRGYLEALVAAAEPAPAGAMGFGPQFYRRRQLETRIRRLLIDKSGESAMSTRRTIAIAGILALTIPATVLAGGAAFPLVTTDTAVQQMPPPPPPAPVPPKPPTAAKAELPPPPPPPPDPAARKAQKVTPEPPGVVPPKSQKQKLTRPELPPPPPPAPPPPPPAAPPKKMRPANAAPPVPPPAPIPAKRKRMDVGEMPPPPPPAPAKVKKGGDEPAPPKPPKAIKKEGFPPPPPPPPPAPVKKGRGGQSMS